MIPNIWIEACARLDAGDPAPLLELLVNEGPPPMAARERVLVSVAKLKAPKPPSQNTITLARATVHVWKRESKIGYRDACEEALRLYPVKSIEVLKTAVAKNRQDVNEAINLLNLVTSD